MKVRCRLCEHESNGFCMKKLNNSKPIKIQLNKPRTCSVFTEDGLRVLGDYRKREAHKTKVKQQQTYNLATAAAVAQMQQQLLARKEKLSQVEETKTEEAPNE